MSKSKRERNLRKKSIKNKMKMVLYDFTNGGNVGEDENRVLIGKKIKSPIYKKMKNEYNEVFLGGMKTLHKDDFWKSFVSVPSTTFPELGSNLVMSVEEEKLKENPNLCIHSESNFTGIRLFAFWKKEEDCFLIWKYIPNHISTGNLY